ALLALRRAARITTRFLVRDAFAFNRWGVLQPGGTPESAARQRAEFVANLDDADYALCARGLANCSIRLYEAISLGRIPLFVNTRCVLPYEWLVNWRSVCVCVDENELPHIADILRDDHARFTPSEFATRQRLARELFERWIRPEGFFAELHRHFPRAVSAVRA
ncbi:MAG: exostosin family protein, partial [Burkholderiales bacterium]|nr:exostosin family protein [Opitutaceae bacterium]